MKRLLIAIITIAAIGCEVTFECQDGQECDQRLWEYVGTDGGFEVVVSDDGDTDTDLDTDCRVEEACTIKYKPTCQFENGASWIRDWKGCVCNDGVVLRYYEDDMCAEGCVENQFGVDYCAEDAPGGE